MPSSCGTHTICMCFFVHLLLLCRHFPAPHPKFYVFIEMIICNCSIIFHRVDDHTKVSHCPIFEQLFLFCYTNTDKQSVDCFQCFKWLLLEIQAITHTELGGPRAQAPCPQRKAESTCWTLLIFQPYPPGSKFMTPRSAKEAGEPRVVLAKLFCGMHPNGSSNDNMFLLKSHI